MSDDDLSNRELAWVAALSTTVVILAALAYVAVYLMASYVLAHL